VFSKQTAGNQLILVVLAAMARQTDMNQTWTWKTTNNNKHVAIQD